MRRSHVHNFLFFLMISLVSCCSLSAQDNFSYRATLDTIIKSGFYNISLSPDIIAKSKMEMEDVRIKDNTGAEIAYILYTESSRPNEESFTEFPTSYSENRTAVIINNILPNSLNKLYLLIKNSEAQRMATLSGSDDSQHWFIIKENIILQNEFTADSDAFVQSVSFPPSSYKYFRITMPGKNILPLNIIKAGVYRHSFTDNIYDALPAPNIIQKDSSDKKSYVYFSFADNYRIDKLAFLPSGANYYKRHFVLFDKNTNNTMLTDDTLSSAKQADIEFHSKTNRLLMVIDNKDNRSLTIQSASAFQLHTSVTAYLDAGKTYSLYFGDSSAIAPSYDLQYFNDSIGNNIQSLPIKNIEKIKRLPTAQTKENNKANWLLWSIIIAVLSLLIYFSYRMIREINNKTNNDVHL